MDKYHVSVIVPVYNRASQIHKCLNALVNQTFPEKDFDIVVVDDYSVDDLEAEIKKYPRVRYVLNKLEFGLPAARNMGIKNANGDIILFLDDDAIIDEDYIEKIVDAFQKNENVGGVTGKLKHVITQDIKKGYWGKLMYAYAKVFGISGFFVNQEGVGEVLDTGFITSNFERHEKITKVKWLSGCNMSFLKKALEETGLFDNCYEGHAYYEDADMSYRVYKKGYDLYAVPDATVDHLVSPVSREKMSRVKYFQLINYNRFFLKNVYDGSKVRYLKHIISHLSLAIPVFVYSIIKWNFGMIKSYLKAETVFFKRLFTGI